MYKKAFLFILTTLFISPCFANGDINDDEDTYSMFSPSKVLDKTRPPYVTSYIDKENHVVKSPVDISLGIAFGMDITNFTFEQTSVNADNSDKLNATGFFGKLDLGLGKKFDSDNIYFGGAISAVYNSAEYEKKLTAGGVSQNLTAKMPYSASIFLVPGVSVAKNTMVYLKAGATMGKLQVEPSDQTIFLIPSVDKYLLGWSAGLGLQTYVIENLSMEVEYLFTYYQSTTVDYQVLSTTVKNTISPYNHQIGIGVTYHF